MIEVQTFFERLTVLVSKHFIRGSHLPQKGFPKQKFSNEEVIVIFLSTLTYVHRILGLDSSFLEDNYGSFHFSLCVNVLCWLIPELRAGEKEISRL